MIKLKTKKHIKNLKHGKISKNDEDVAFEASNPTKLLEIELLEEKEIYLNKKLK
jgi:hypothetical protein